MFLIDYLDPKSNFYHKTVDTLGLQILGENVKVFFTAITYIYLGKGFLIHLTNPISIFSLSPNPKNLKITFLERTNQFIYAI